MGARLGAWIDSSLLPLGFHERGKVLGGDPHDPLAQPNSADLAARDQPVELPNRDLESAGCLAQRKQRLGFHSRGSLGGPLARVPVALHGAARHNPVTLRRSGRATVTTVNPDREARLTEMVRENQAQTDMSALCYLTKDRLALAVEELLLLTDRSAMALSLLERRLS